MRDTKMIKTGYLPEVGEAYKEVMRKVLWACLGKPHGGGGISPGLRWIVRTCRGQDRGKGIQTEGVAGAKGRRWGIVQY